MAKRVVTKLSYTELQAELRHGEKSVRAARLPRN